VARPINAVNQIKGANMSLTQSISSDGGHGTTQHTQAQDAQGQVLQSASVESRAVQRWCELPVEQIAPDPSQPRRHFDDAALAALADSMSEYGLLWPVLVRSRAGGSYQLIAGERRWRAAQITGLLTIPALVCRYNDAISLERELIENMKRENLSRVENARACGTLAVEYGLSYQQIADRVNRSVAGVSNLVSLLKLSEEILASMERGELGMNHALTLLKAKDPEVRGELARKAAKQQWASKKGWPVAVLEARAILSNEDPAAAMNEAVPVPLSDRRGQEQYLDETGLAVARVWGDVLGAVTIVSLNARGQVCLKVEFNSPGAALDAANRLAEAIARGLSTS
jgi:ParB family chromosome partitioning protein